MLVCVKVVRVMWVEGSVEGGVEDCGEVGVRGKGVEGKRGVGGAVAWVKEAKRR